MQLSLPRFLDAVETVGINAAGEGSSQGNCRVEVEEIGQGQQLVVLSATQDLKEGGPCDVLTQELDSPLPSDVLLTYGRVLPEDFVQTLEVQRAMIDENFLSAALILAKEELEVEEFVNLTGAIADDCDREIRAGLRLPGRSKPPTLELKPALGRLRVEGWGMSGLVIEEVKEAVARAEDAGAAVMEATDVQFSPTHWVSKAKPTLIAPSSMMAFGHS
eukprot:Skav216701  [mRNA]  locus=scaffold91:365464:369739:+ [translate_table: standard]